VRRAVARLDDAERRRASEEVPGESVRRQRTTSSTSSLPMRRPARSIA